MDHWSWGGAGARRALAVLSIVTGALAVPSGAVQGQPPLPDSMEVRVTIREILDLNNDLDWPDDADFYVNVKIGDVERDNYDTPDQDAQEGEFHIFPNWEFSASVDPNTGPTPVRIEVRDEDGFLKFDDDLAKVTHGDGIVDLTIDALPCAVHGDVEAACGTFVTSEGGNEDAKVGFIIDAVLPEAGPGLRVRCMHEPLWPQPGATVNINAFAVDEALTQHPVVDELEIRVNGSTMATGAASGTGVVGLATASFPASGPFSYECITRRGGTYASTTPRMVLVGPPTGPGVPVIYTGPAASRIDLVIFPDGAGYPGGASDPAFLGEVRQLLEDNWLGDSYLLANQGRFNFWLGRERAGIDADPGTCRAVEPPIETWDEYSYADAGIVLHKDGARDCADRSERFFSALLGRARVAIHESGHQPFGLADEYCCDSHYFEPDYMPNLWDDASDCQDDAIFASLGTTACRSFVDDDGDDWFTNDPSGDDIMENNGSFQRLDRARFDDMFAACRKAGC